MSIVQAVESGHNPALDAIERTAINSSGRLSSLYDRCRDCVLRQLSVSIEERSPQSQKSVRCELVKGDTSKSQNLLQMIGIEEELRLSLLLNLTPRTEITAVIDHCCPIDKYTRFLYYSYVNREEGLSDKAAEFEECVKSSMASTDATHIITGVSYGINVVVVLQLRPDDEIIRKIDGVLEKIRASLECVNYVLAIVKNNKKLLEENIETKAYSNITDLNQMTSLFNIYQYIGSQSNESRVYPPLKYTLKPIQLLYPDCTESRANLDPFPSAINDKVEQHLIQLSNLVKRLKYSLRYHVSTLLPQPLQDQLHEAGHQWQKLNKTYEDEVERLRWLIFQIRSGQKDASEIDETLKDNNLTTLKDNIEKLIHRVTDLEAKGRWISDLPEQHFEYCDVAKFNLDKRDYEQTLKRTLINDNHEYKILCFSDTLKKDDQLKWDNLALQLGNEQNNLRIIYADFSYCSFDLQDMIILPSDKKNNHQDTQKQRSSTINEIVNIVLLGESGAGKSTFINAFVNYLTFESLGQAEDKKPIVLIPVSFVMTTGRNFDEQIVKFGDVDNLKNEDFDHSGQSVTQHCKSYVFDLDRHGGRKLRIIDTPGFGDTRGLDQDDRNMQHILEYINNLTHLNAICFLFKSTASQLSNYFQTCLTQLLDLLGSDARQNIIFCFTNARSTFYTPGNTAPLLRTILDSPPKIDIPFKKENTFCFDSESFRYLAALQNSIVFDNLDRQEYENSWSTSATESKNLINYICTKLNAYTLDNKRQSIKHAQLEICQMIRPMLETMRNLLRNIILREMEPGHKSIELHPVVIHRPASICYVCKRDSIRLDKFWIVADDPHEFLSKCLFCLCTAKQHTPIHYVLDYDFMDNSSNYDRKQMDNAIQQLRHASNIFAHFLMHVDRSLKDDPFWNGLFQMIVEENVLCRSERSNHLNLKLVEYLNSLQFRYEEHMNEMKSYKECMALPKIYQWIEAIRKYPMVYEQMIAAKEGQKALMKEYEYEVPKNLTNTFLC